MAYYSGYGAHCSKHRDQAASDSPPLFDHTSGGYSSQPGGYPDPGAKVAYNVNHLLGDPMANVVMAYGNFIASPRTVHIGATLFCVCEQTQGLNLATVCSELSTFHLLAYSSYKYVGMILSVLTGLLFSSDGYYTALAWILSALMYFIVRSLQTAALGPDNVGDPATRQHLQLYLTLGAAALQTLITYWLTFHLV
ncbi:Protein YIF1A [Sciurus carolinensis]|uniref:Protein YIF1 n=1 Tax=Sciurus carolinensis TaxID=30640 RepID=A0AA41MNI3_SCICA|nr:Protein YIF1A [Sciurus carolinensis]